MATTTTNKSGNETKNHQKMHNAPAWFDGRCINESQFCEEFLRDHPMKSVGGTFFTVNGKIDDETTLRKEIFDRIRPWVTQGLSKKAATLLEAVRLHCYQPDFPIHQDRIHVANGTLYLNGQFTEEMEFCRNRLPVQFNRNAKRPDVWLSFLDQLLDKNDIETLQELIGYCLIPSTKGQKMLLMVGKGGEGKSRIGIVLRSLLGTSMNTGSIAKIETNAFARADLEHELLLFDDDMKLEALPQTNYIKAIVTAELPMDLEKKGKQSYQGELYARFFGLGNGTLQALYDRSEGFFRRQIILTTKDRDPNRRDDPYLGEKMCAEAEGIFLWAMEGLHRLIANQYHFTESEKAKDNRKTAMRDGNNIPDFLQSEGYIRFRADSEISSRQLYALYELWCEDNAEKPLAARTMSSFLKSNCILYNLENTTNVRLPNGRRVRGFMGIEAENVNVAPSRRSNYQEKLQENS